MQINSHHLRSHCTVFTVHQPQSSLNAASGNPPPEVVSMQIEHDYAML